MEPAPVWGEDSSWGGSLMRRAVVLCLVVLALVAPGGVAQAGVAKTTLAAATTGSQAPAKAGTPAKPLTPEQLMAGTVTNAERQAAAKAQVKKGVKPGTRTVKVNGKLTTLGLNTAAPAAATPVTDYFGSIPNYANSPVPASVAIWGDGDGSALATATVDPTTGAITSVTVTNGGTGYTLANTTAFIVGGGGTGAVLTPAITAGVITAIAVTSGGSLYNSVPGIRKFVDTLPGLGSAAQNDLGNYIPVAVADQTSYPGADYYEIAVVQYTEQLHKDLPATTLRGYVQIETPVFGVGQPLAGKSNHVALTYPNGNPILNKAGQPVFAVDKPSYLGPVVVAQKNLPTRVKFDNYLPNSTMGNGTPGSDGSLFIPVDTTDMGSGPGPVDSTGASCDWMMGGNCAYFSQNRATVHLHGGFTPWISDGTPNQWTTPAGESTKYPKGVSTDYVPDMWYDANGNGIASCTGQTVCNVAGASNSPGDGSMTFFYTNQQSARLMFYHDHAYGITRLNVYAGEAAGFVLQDPVLDSTQNCTISAAAVVTCTTVSTSLVSQGIVPSAQIPLVIQDKTFVPSASQLAMEDPTWNTTAYGGYGNLWFPHVYMPNQNPGVESGANMMGRWDYGPWFWPPYTGLVNGPVANSLYNPVTAPWENSQNPGIPNPSLVPESFMDTPLVNGTAYPVLNVQPQSYRLSILNAGNDRNLNLSLFQSAASFAGLTGQMWNPDGTLANANFGEVPMVPACPCAGPAVAGYVVPDQLDDRAGGVPDVRAAGPSMIQIGSEGGILPAPVVLKNQPVGYNYNRRDIVVLNVSQRALFMGPAERADVIVDFSAFAGKTLILYNDAPAPVPAFDTRYDYYTGDPDQTMEGGAPSTLPGYGPNMRTVMQIQVAATTPAAAFNLTNLQNAWNAAYVASQAAPIVPELAYNGPTGPYPDPTVTHNNYARMTNHSLWIGNPVNGVQVLTGGTGYSSVTPPLVSFIGGGGINAAAHAVVTAGVVTSVVVDNPGSGYTTEPVVKFTGGGGTGADAVAIGWKYMEPKAIQELFETQYGRMNATLGFELPFTTVNTQTTIPMGYAEPSTENLIASGLMTQLGTLTDGTQIWKITHNGVDTHTIHFHLFNVQLVNRVGWDGAIRPPDANELGWKESVRMNPLEDAIVAFKPAAPILPFKIGDSYRSIDTTRPETAMIDTFDATTGNAITVMNMITDFAWEYVWHCHLLGHEENDMMRPMTLAVSPEAPTNGTAVASGSTVWPATITLTWTDNSTTPKATNFYIQRATDPGFTANLTYFTVPGPTPPTTFTDTTPADGTTYYYQVRAENSVAYSLWSGTASAHTLPHLVITASSPSMVRGTTVPTITPIYSGFLPGDTPANSLTTLPTCSTTATSASPIGTYPSTCTGAASTKYTISYVAGIVTVTPPILTITASSPTVQYLQAIPAITPIYSGFLPGDNPGNSLTTLPTCSTAAVAGSAVGTYPSTCSGAVAPNYLIAYVAGVVTITKANQTITFPPIADQIIGTPDFSANATASSGLPVTLSASGQCSIVAGLIHLTAVGSCTVTANQAGNANYNAAPPVSRTFAITKAPSTTVLTSNYSVTKVNNPVVFTATVSGAFGTPTGTVQFRSDGNNIGSPATLSGGVATLSYSGLSVGTHTITAVYSGNATYNGSTSNNLTQTVRNRLNTTTAVTSNINPTVYGQSVTFTATVTPENNSLGVAPTGTVQWTVNGTNVGSPVALNGSGQATFTTTTLAVATSNIRANYTGDTNYNGANSAVYAQTVYKAGTTAVVTLTSPVSAATTVTWTATISVSAPGGGTVNSGTIQFRLDGVNFGALVTVSGGVATLVIPPGSLPVGTHQVRASYGGNASYYSTLSPNTTQVINP